jgi:hypothetical protein
VKFRLRPAVRFAGPVLVLLGLLVTAVSVTGGLAVVIVGGAALAGLVPMLEVTDQGVRYRGLVGGLEVDLDEITDVRLRRVALGPPRPPRPSGRGLLGGPFARKPIRLRIVGGEETIQLTVGLWHRWPDLVVRVLEVTGIEPDSRTAGRLERYG